MDALFREIRNFNNQLLCKANDHTGEVETQGPHHSAYHFNIPVGCAFMVTRGNCKSRITRTSTSFAVEDEVIVA